MLLESDLSLRLADVTLPLRASGDVRIRTEWTGLCGSDLHVLATGAWVSSWPAQLGHEVVGVVGESDDPAFPVGTRVVPDSRIPCRACPDCARSVRFCRNLTWLGESRPGGYGAEFDVPGSSLARVPDTLPAELAVLAEPLAVVQRALDEVPAARSVLLLGYGPIGALLHAELGRSSSDASIAVAEPQPERHAAALASGATADEPTAEYDLVIDAAGFSGSVATAFSRVRRGGAVLVVAIGPAPIGIPAQDLVEKGVSVVGSVGFEDGDLQRALTSLDGDQDRFARVVTHRVDLADFPDFLARIREEQPLKVIVRGGAA
jgi:threonine dehydrogenase-like Zn-dependent dehydrogenase